MWLVPSGQAVESTVPGSRGTGGHTTAGLASLPPWHQQAGPTVEEYRGAPWHTHNSTTATQLPRQEHEAHEVPPWQLRRRDQALSSTGQKGTLEEENDEQMPARQVGGSSPRTGRGILPFREKQTSTVSDKGGGRKGGVRGEQDAPSSWRLGSSGRGRSVQSVDDGYGIRGETTPAAGRDAERSPGGGWGDHRRMQGDSGEKFPSRGGRQAASRLPETSLHYTVSTSSHEGPSRAHDPDPTRRRAKSRSRERRLERRRSGSRSPPTQRGNSLGRHAAYRCRESTRASHREVETDSASSGRYRPMSSAVHLNAHEGDRRLTEDRASYRSEEERAHSQPGRDRLLPWGGEADRRAEQTVPSVSPTGVRLPPDAASSGEVAGGPAHFYFDPTAGTTFLIATQPAVFSGLPPGTLPSGQAPFPFSAPLLWTSGVPAHPGDPQFSKAHDELARTRGAGEGSARRCREEEDMTLAHRGATSHRDRARGDSRERRRDLLPSAERRARNGACPERDAGWGRVGRGRGGMAGRDAAERGDRSTGPRPQISASSGRGSENWLKRWEERAAHPSSFREAHGRGGSGSWASASAGRRFPHSRDSGAAMGEGERTRDEGGFWRSGAEGARLGREKGGGEDERAPRHAYDEFDRARPPHLGEHDHRDKGMRSKCGGAGSARGRGPGESRTGGNRGSWSDDERDEIHDGAHGQPEGTRWVVCRLFAGHSV